jgi:serine/threonine protein kinase/formylglycine-generating enzyme required for sulfatase activity/dienelactone hydrolase
MANETSKPEEAVFKTAIQLATPAEREAYVRQACQDDPQLLADVQSLLRHHDSSSFLDGPVFDPGVKLDQSPIAEGPGTVVGRYKLLEKIGEGGMAVVYMAEQAEPIQRKVALKIIKLGMDTKQVIARFEAERQALAMMDHPNIAKVLDAGATETGRPYFVMDLVTGVSITEYCDQGSLSTKDRLALFIQVCNAVQHAHQKGIIHRDIKPSNVMITLRDGEPFPKVIDFGIAKATNQRLTEKTLFTRYAHIIGTPAYMSPEQAQMSGLEVDTRTDIYSLGALLYELLTGTTPFATETFQEAGYAEIERIIRETDPPRPSTRLRTLGQALIDVARWRQASAGTLQKLLKGDLDWIVMKCLEKERARRYETPHALAEDIERHLRHEPILARSPSIIYRLQKFTRRHRTRMAISAAGALLLGGLVVTVIMYWQASNLQWATGIAIPRIVELVKEADYRAAFPLAQKARRYVREDPTLTELWPRICKDYSIQTTPAGADVWCREYSATDEPWQYLGRSPLEKVTLAQCMYRWRIDKDGFTVHECVSDSSFQVRLREADLADQMIWIDASVAEIPSNGYAETTRVEVPAYWIDKYEVTNEQFKGFVDGGGYDSPEYWQGLKFVRNGRDLDWAEAVTHFHDSTGQPGPSTWAEGTYPQGQGKHPVAGVSWFEANAYAMFIGKSLPTVHHWQKAACLGEPLMIVPFSNFGRGTAAVGDHLGVGHTGAYDMAGNAKEWCLNAVDDSVTRRYILGGGWGEPTYMLVAEDSRSPWDRSPRNGFRCVKYAQGEEPLGQMLFASLDLYPSRDMSSLEPFSDEEFRSLRAQYKYDPTPLNPIVESTEGGSPFWPRKEKITFDAAYGGEHVIAHLFLPEVGKPPYQTVVYFPGVSAVYQESFNGLPQSDLTEYIITSGRALLFPIYKGTFERPAARGRIWNLRSVMETPLAYRDWTIQIAKDLSRCIDYLETRDDIDSDRVAFYGMSWGATLGPIMMAVEDRLDTGIFVVGGIPPIDLPRSFDIALYAQRVKAPVLMVNGREDAFLPLTTSQIPLYELLGTPDEHKKHRLYPGSHGMFGLFYEQIRGDVLNWLDRYLGPVE